MLLPAEQRAYLPILISSSVSASPIHSNWKSCKDCENFCTAMDKSRIQEKKKQEIRITPLELHWSKASCISALSIFSVYKVSFLPSFLDINRILKSPSPFQNQRTWDFLDTSETGWCKISNINTCITLATEELSYFLKNKKLV